MQPREGYWISQNLSRQQTFARAKEGKVYKAGIQTKHMKMRKETTRSGLVGKLAGFGRKAAGAAVVAGALYGGMNSQAKAEMMTYSGSPVAQASASGSEYFQYGVSSSDPNVGGFSVVAFNATYNDPSIKLGLDPNDFAVDTSIYPTDKFWVSYLTLQNEGGEVEKIWSNRTPSLQVGDKLTGKISVENRVGSAVYAPLSLDVLNYDLSGNQNGVTDILCTYEVDTDANGKVDLSGSILASDAIENYDGNLASWQQLCMPQFDHRNGAAFGTLTFEAVGVPEASSLALLASAGIAGAGVGLVSRRKRDK